MLKTSLKQGGDRQVAGQTRSEEPRQALRTKRAQLIDALHLIHDPFRSSVSESEVSADFASIYVEPQTSRDSGEDSLLDWLRQERSSFLFADYGMGKSATRLALEYTLRNDYTSTPTLVVRYLPSVDQQLPVADLRRHHEHQIAAEMTVDLLVQFFERLSERAGGPNQISPTEAEALGRVIRASPGSFQRVLGRIVRGSVKPAHIWGGQRLAARPEIVTKAWLDGMRRIITPALVGPPGPRVWQQLVADARALGFHSVFLTLDAVDEYSASPAAHRDLIDPLIRTLPEWQRQRVFFKVFLPAQTRGYFDDDYKSIFNALTPTPELATIARSTPDHLSRIISERLRAAARSNASLSSLDWLTGQEIDVSIQDTIARLADGSPRAAIALASALLDYHCNHGFADGQRLWLTAGEWREFLLQQQDLSPQASPG